MPDMNTSNDQDLYGSSRKLAAILFADIAGYSKMMHADENAALLRLTRFQTVLNDEVVKVGGRIVKNYGDGSLCLFRSAVHAVHCAKNLQEELLRDPTVPIRVGLHTGDIIEKQDDIYGDGINIASRLESMGSPGSVLFSKSIYDKIRNHTEFETTYLGLFELKNINEPIKVYALSNEGLIVPELVSLTTNISKPVVEKTVSKVMRYAPWLIVVLAVIGMKFWNDVTNRIPMSDKSIAVLPFKNDSADPSNDYFCNGMMEDILTQLQQIGDLKVISRSSVMPYKDTPKPIREVANELDVSYVLEGSVRKAENQVLVTAQLINGKDESQTWAGKFDEQLSAANLFQIQGTIASNIAAQLETEFSGASDSSQDVPTGNLEAYDFYLRGQYFYNDRFRGEEFAMNAIRMFQNAIDLDPNFAKAHLRLAYGHAHVYSENIDGSQERADLATTHFEKSLALSPQDPEVIEGQGWYQYQIESDYLKARDIFSNVTKEYPRMPTPLNALGVINSRLGNWEEAEQNFRRSISLDPKYRSTHLNYFYNLFGQRKFLEAKNYLDELLNISPENARAHREMMNLMIAVNGNVEEALNYYNNSGIDDADFLRKLRIMRGDLDELLLEIPNEIDSATGEELLDYAKIFYLTGDQKRSREFAQRGISKMSALLQQAPNDYRSQMELALLYALAGNESRALSVANQTVATRSVEKDALLGPQLEFDRAKILNVLGQTQEAIELLRTLMQIPAPVTVESFKNSPLLKNLSNDPEFTRLLNEFELI